MYKALTAFVAIILLAGCPGEEPVTTLLAMDEAVYTIDDFRDWQQQMYPSNEPPFQRSVAASYLENFVEHRLLLHAASKQGITLPEESGSKLEREMSAISSYLNRQVYSNMTIDRSELIKEYERRYPENRVLMQSILVSEKERAQEIANRARRNPDDFEKLMDEHNPEGIRQQGMDEVEQSAEQLPDAVREAVFGVSEPGIVGPVEWDNVFLIVRIKEFLGRRDLEEVRPVLEEVLVDRQRQMLRQQEIERLRTELVSEYNPQLVLESEAFVIMDETMEVES